MYTCVIAHMWRSEDKMGEPVLSFHHVGPSDAQVAGLGSSFLSAFSPPKGAANSSSSPEEHLILYTTLNYRANIKSFGTLCVSLASSAFFLTQDSALLMVTGRPCWVSCSLTLRHLLDQDQKIRKRTLLTDWFCSLTVSYMYMMCSAYILPLTFAHLLPSQPLLSSSHRYQPHLIP